MAFGEGEALPAPIGLRIFGWRVPTSAAPPSRLKHEPRLIGKPKSLIRRGFRPITGRRCRSARRLPTWFRFFHLNYRGSPVTRLTGAVVALLCLIPTATASLDRPKVADRPSGMRLVLPKERPKEHPRDTTEVPPPAEAQLTAETEVLLDGRQCPYKEVPATASITRLELAPDGKTITRIEFRSKK